MQIRLRNIGNAVILDLEGPLLLGDAEKAFRAQVDELLQAGKRNLAVNLAGVSEMDSSGIGALVRTFTSARKAGGNCKFFGVTPRVMQLLKMVRLDQVLELAEDEAAALAAF